MKSDRSQDSSQPFLLRVWKEEVEGSVVWAGRLQHILTGKGRLFHDWAGLIEQLESSLRETEGEQASPGSMDPQRGPPTGRQKGSHRDARNEAGPAPGSGGSNPEG